MDIVEKISVLKKNLASRRLDGSIGFVPTMGALHKGHLSLVQESVKNNSSTVVSIFVNPTQFNDKSDLEHYPRNLDKDCKMLENEGCDMVFAPEVTEMYPKPDKRTFNFGALETIMEGRHRPGHFNGVGQIVSKLFEIVEPNRAYFGLKDFQQLAIVKKLVKINNYPIEVVPCVTMREKDGLAMSSRNMRLEKNKRRAAPFIYSILKEVANMSKEKSPNEIKTWVEQNFAGNNELELEYFEIIDDFSLHHISKFSAKSTSTACIAVHAGKIRLIDNIQIIS